MPSDEESGVKGIVLVDMQDYSQTRFQLEDFVVRFKRMTITALKLV